MTTASIAPERADTVGLAGQGLMHTTLTRLLAGTCSVLPLDLSLNPPSDGAAAHAGLDACGGAVLAGDGWDPDLHRAFNAECLARALPWLLVYVERGHAVIGPCTLPGQAGCSLCAQTRRNAARFDAQELSQLAERFATEFAAPSGSWLTTCGAELVAALVADELGCLTSRPHQARTRNAVVRVDLAELVVSVHPFLPDPWCAACGDLPDDTEQSAWIVTRPAPKASLAGYRVRPLSGAQDRDRLLTRYVDAQVGIIPSLTKNGDSMFPGARAPIGLRHSFHQSNGSGRTLTVQAAEITAITEAMERYGGLAPCGKRTVVRASYAQLGDKALDPTTLGLHSETQHALPGFRYQRYHPDLTLSWVWGYSFARQRPLLVPERYAYYGLRHREPAGRAFVSENSNGCALGGCLEEAILYGLLEVAERDAFLMTWYARLPVPRVEVASLRGRTAALIIERIEHTTGYTIHIFDTTMEQRIPCVWVMAVDEQDRPDQPKVMCAAGAHLDPERALEGALLELARQLQYATRGYRDDRDRILAMVADPRKVRVMADHAPLYYAPEVFDRLLFLVDTPRQQTFDEAFHGRPGPNADLSTDLHETIGRYLDTGLDVIVVDQTGPEHALEQFACVKVIVPGAVPMVFGYDHRRIHGLDRLYHVGYELGYHPRPLIHAELNPHPHPFP
ncbi:MAG TPA: TOMM precursor leader peptide-binding protein [Pseudonocardiaceae bacterium]|nr:TOMM precursor leader peptide-binding protein [Pseudonocardiaceae bacterium]